ncbi:MAG: hypothetical protein J6B72_05060 [Clostridia bacterium]|nr:hypothetical protein [Clostridia bacterium]
MTVKELASALDCKIACMPDESREITGGYAGDLLSWVMGRASSGDAWVTIMSNINIVAVASLADTACIILSEGVIPDDGVVEKATEVGVNILMSQLDTYALCASIFKLI